MHLPHEQTLILPWPVMQFLSAFVASPSGPPAAQKAPDDTRAGRSANPETDDAMLHVGCVIRASQSAGALGSATDDGQHARGAHLLEHTTAVASALIREPAPCVIVRDCHRPAVAKAAALNGHSPEDGGGVGVGTGVGVGAGVAT
jgi:hypothetical protein